MVQKHLLPYPLKTLELFESLRPLGEAIFLDSGQPQSNSAFARFDILTAAPTQLVRFDEQGLSVRQDGLWRSETGDPFKYLRKILEPLDRTDDSLPFTGGLLGYWGYDLARTIERLPSKAAADIDFPWMQVGLYDWAIVIDHQQEESWLVAQGGSNRVFIEKLLSLIKQQNKQNREKKPENFRLETNWQSNLTKEEYRSALETVDDYINAGDCYQINFAQRFRSRYQGDTWAAYLRIREQAPTPFSAFLDFKGAAILCFSPERFMKVEPSGRVETRPIKGTRPRGSDPESDRKMAEDLLAAPKDQAENLMIVDLLRNDLSRVCNPGSVKVPELFKLETYPNVHHLVSSVEGQLGPDQTPLDLLRSSFPGGSITGAPKVRAMEIIDELEPNRRSIYCGSIGYISANGRMDTNICIRTLLCNQNDIFCWAGGGIVADSDIDDEYQETLNKVNNLLRAAMA